MLEGSSRECVSSYGPLAAARRGRSSSDSVSSCIHGHAGQRESAAHAAAVHSVSLGPLSEAVGGGLHRVRPRLYLLLVVTGGSEQYPRQSRSTSARSSRAPSRCGPERLQCSRQRDQI